MESVSTKILRFLAHNRGQCFTTYELVKRLRLNRSSAYKAVKRLQRLGLLENDGKVRLLPPLTEDETDILFLQPITDLLLRLHEDYGCNTEAFLEVLRVFVAEAERLMGR